MLEKVKRNRFLRAVFYRYGWFLERRSYEFGRKNRIYNRGIRIHTRIQIRGNGNRVLIEPGVLMKGGLIRIQGNNCLVHIRRNAFLSGTELWVEDDGCRLEIGEGTFVGPAHLAVTEDGSSLVVGADCMLSSRVQVRTGDSHSILSSRNGCPVRINPARPVRIGDHVWIGEGARIMKGVTLGRDVIVSAGAIVTSSFEKELLVGGVPAVVLKQNVTWDKRRL